jgi:ribosome-binding protein aMBF1 (putative translation factor)
MKCSICGKEIETTFLGKIKGNYVKVDGKLYDVCNACFAANKENTKTKINK